MTEDTVTLSRAEYDALLERIEDLQAALALDKAKREAVEAGVITFDRAILAHLMLPDGRTVAQHLQPRIETAYATGEMPALPPDYSEEAS